MQEHLLGFDNNLRIELQQGLSVIDIGVQPGILLVDFPIENDATQYAEQEFDGYPHIEVAIGVGKEYLQSRLYQSG